MLLVACEHLVLRAEGKGFNAGVDIKEMQATEGFEALIEGLPDRARATLRLRFVDDLEYEAIAVRLDCTPEAARQRVSTALRTLRRTHAAA